MADEIPIEEKPKNVLEVNGEIVERSTPSVTIPLDNTGYAIVAAMKELTEAIQDLSMAMRGKK